MFEPLVPESLPFNGRPIIVTPKRFPPPPPPRPKKKPASSGPRALRYYQQVTRGLT